MADPIQAISASMTALSKQYEVITHNIANADTPGFKRRMTAFSQVLQDRMNGDGNAGADGASLVSRASLDYSQGAIQQTGRTLDAAIQGDGFFTLETPEGELYTRNGSFQVNERGHMVDTSGRTVAGESGPIIVPQNVSLQELVISRDGGVSVSGRPLGKLKISQFLPDQQPLPIGRCLYVAKEDVQPKRDAENVTIHQGYRESSNVNVTEELVALIKVARMYEGNVKSYNAQDGRADTLMRVAMG